MQQIEQSTGLSGVERRRAVDEALTTLGGHNESPAEVAHEARNMVTALGLFCDLLEEPGVLAPSSAHYGKELRQVATTSRRLVEKLIAINFRRNPEPAVCAEILQGRREVGTEATANEKKHGNLDPLPAKPIDNLAAELLAIRNLLAALAGPAIALTVAVEGGALPVRLTGEDLTRVLVNLVKNAAEAMPSGGRIAIGVHEFHCGTERPSWLMLTIEDNGPGVPEKALDKIFESGYSTHAKSLPLKDGWVASHRGLGLSITRSLIETAGGRIHAANRTRPGARFEIALPVRSR
jgi:signal transduction histidine kinase